MAPNQPNAATTAKEEEYGYGSLFTNLASPAWLFPLVRPSEEIFNRGGKPMPMSSASIKNLLFRGFLIWPALREGIVMAGNKAGGSGLPPSDRGLSIAQIILSTIIALGILFAAFRLTFPLDRKLTAVVTELTNIKVELATINERVSPIGSIEKTLNEHLVPMSRAQMLDKELALMAVQGKMGAESLIKGSDHYVTTLKGDSLLGGTFIQEIQEVLNEVPESTPTVGVVYRVIERVDPAHFNQRALDRKLSTDQLKALVGAFITKRRMGK